MPTYKFVESAQTDLSEIITYTLEKWGIDQASIYIDGLEVLAQSLADTPKIGKACNNLSEGLRAFPFQSHILYYLEEPHGITIVRVLHKNMAPKLHFEDMNRA